MTKKAEKNTSEELQSKMDALEASIEAMEARMKNRTMDALEASAAAMRARIEGQTSENIQSMEPEQKDYHTLYEREKELNCEAFDALEWSVKKLRFLYQSFSPVDRGVDISQQYDDEAFEGFVEIMTEIYGRLHSAMERSYNFKG